MSSFLPVTRLQCFKSAWMTAVLHEGLRFPPRYKDLTSVQYIGKQEVHWTLGALLYKTKYYPLRSALVLGKNRGFQKCSLKFFKSIILLVNKCIIRFCFCTCLYIQETYKIFEKQPHRPRKCGPSRQSFLCCRVQFHLNVRTVCH